MHVWDAAGGEALRFDADAFAEPQLGWIVEHALLQDRLWAALPAAGVAVRTEAAVDALQQEEGGVVLTLEDGRELRLEELMWARPEDAEAARRGQAA